MRVHASSPGEVDDPAERFATYYGQWANTSMRSGFAAAQNICQIFLKSRPESL